MPVASREFLGTVSWVYWTTTMTPPGKLAARRWPTQELVPLPLWGDLVRGTQRRGFYTRGEQETDGSRWDLAAWDFWHTFHPRAGGVHRLDLRLFHFEISSRSWERSGRAFLSAASRAPIRVSLLRGKCSWFRHCPGMEPEPLHVAYDGNRWEILATVRCPSDPRAAER